MSLRRRVLQFWIIDDVSIYAVFGLRSPSPSLFCSRRHYRADSLALWMSVRLMHVCAAYHSAPVQSDNRTKIVSCGLYCCHVFHHALPTPLLSRLDHCHAHESCLCGAETTRNAGVLVSLATMEDVTFGVCCGGLRIFGTFSYSSARHLHIIH